MLREPCPAVSECVRSEPRPLYSCGHDCRTLLGVELVPSASRLNCSASVLAASAATRSSACPRTVIVLTFVHDVTCAPDFSECRTRDVLNRTRLRASSLRPLHPRARTLGVPFSTAGILTSGIRSRESEKFAMQRHELASASPYSVSGAVRRGSATESLPAVSQRLANAERELRVQFTRIAQLQAQLDVVLGAFRRSPGGVHV